MEPGEPKGEMPAPKLEATHDLPTTHGVSRGRKRTLIITLVAVGAGALGLAALASRTNCTRGPNPAVGSPAQTSCGSGRGWSGGYFGGGSGASQSSVARGGFGGSASAHAAGS